MDNEDIKITAENLSEAFANFEHYTPNETRKNGWLQLSKEQQDVVSATIKTYTDNPSEQMLDEVMKLAKTHPTAFEALYDWSGNRPSYDKKVKLYEDMMERCEKNSLADNLDAVHALIHNRYFHYNRMVGKKEDITTLPAEANGKLVKIFAIAAQNSSNDNAPYYCREFIGELNRRDAILNFEPKNPQRYGITFDEVRKQISVRKDNVDKVDAKFFVADKENKMLIILAEKYNKYQYHSTQVMDTGKIDRAELEGYKKARDMIVNVAVAQTPKYDASKQGEEKGVAQQFEEFAGKIWGEEHFDMSGRRDFPISIYTDAYLTSIYQDIKAGQAHKLNDNAVKALFMTDKDGYWLRQINEKEPEVAKKMIDSNSQYLSKVGRETADFVVNKEGHINKGGATYTLESSKNLSTAEKEAYYQAALDHHTDKMNTEGAKKKEDLKQYQALTAKLNEVNAQISANRIKSAALSKIYDAYQAVVDKTKNKDPQGKEEGLSRVNVEKILADFPNNVGQLQMPDEKAPLLFGGKEKERLAGLARQITAFNSVVYEQINQAKTYKVDFTDMKGKMLNKDSAKAVEEQMPALQEQYRQVFAQLQSEPFKNMSEKWELQKIQQMENNVQQAEQGIAHVRQRKAKLQDQAKTVLAPEQSTLQAVTPEMSKEQKASVRAANKKVNDPLTVSRSERAKAHQN